MGRVAGCLRAPSEVCSIWFKLVALRLKSPGPVDYRLLRTTTQLDVILVVLPVGGNQDDMVRLIISRRVFLKDCRACRLRATRDLDEL